MSENIIEPRWTRSQNGMFLGVCKGLAPAFGIKVGAFRILWLMSFFFAGAGLGLYFLLAICLPREDRIADVHRARLLGVCAAIAKRNRVNVSLVRFLALCSLFLSLGTTVIGYVVMYFVMKQDQASSDNNPATPPDTTHTFE